MYIISGECKVKNECRETLINMSLSLIPLSQAEPGCLSYSFFEDKARPGVFLFFERWKTREDIDEHFEKKYFKDFAQRFPELIDGDANIEIHHIASTEII